MQNSMRHNSQKQLPRWHANGTQAKCSAVGGLLFACLLSVNLVGCWTRTASDVVVYAALDREFSESILQQSSERLGLKVLP
ncbi:MAG: hypothetical protein VX189_08935, partial [Planctomycetota bacterium]|nr:hypothetical protein [Planctomycetota bacterium]